MPESVVKTIERVMAPFMRLVRLVVARAVVELVNDGTKLQTVQISLLAGELQDGVERFQNYGFSGMPVPADGDGAPEAAVVFVGGDRSHGLVVALDDRRHRRKDLTGGQVVVYTASGDEILLKNDGEIVVKAATKVTIEAPDVQMTGNLKVDGNIDADGDITAQGDVSDSNVTNPTMQDIRDRYNAHTGHLVILGVTPGASLDNPQPM